MVLWHCLVAVNISWCKCRRQVIIWSSLALLDFLYENVCPLDIRQTVANNMVLTGLKRIVKLYCYVCLSERDRHHVIDIYMVGPLVHVILESEINTRHATILWIYFYMTEEVIIVLPWKDILEIRKKFIFWRDRLAFSDSEWVTCMLHAKEY